MKHLYLSNKDILHKKNKMSFTPSEFWKNFRLGTELSISGNFIYNGLYCFELMPHFYNEDETFEFLYNISVGIERLQKICIILIEHNEEDNQHEFQKSLISHNHSDLHARIIKNKTINLGKSHLKFLSTLTKFYKSSRYSKFQIDSVYEQNTSKTELIKFIEESLEIDISIDMMNCTENDLKIKQFIGKTIGKFCKEYYNIVKAECHKLNIYTYEIPPDSKAFKIFMSEKFDFGDEKIIQKEILKDVRHEIGAVASFRDVLVVNRLPKTRSGKILRKLLRNIADDLQYNVPSTIDDIAIINEIKSVYQKHHIGIHK